jgi:septin family protein
MVIAFLSRICSNKSLGLSPLEQLEAEKHERENKITKTESEMEQVFETKVKEKRKKLKEMEAEVCLNFSACAVWRHSE